MQRARRRWGRTQRGPLSPGRYVAALLWFLVVTAGYVLILPGVVLHLFCVVSAASSAHRLDDGTSFARLQPGS